MDHVPELADLNKAERRMVMMYFLANESSMSKSQLQEGILVGAIIFGQIAGLAGGAIYWKNPFWGPLAGGTIGLTIVMVVFYFGSMLFSVPRLRRFLQEDHSKYLLNWLRIARNVQSGSSTPSKEEVERILRRCDVREGTLMGEGQLAELTKRATYDTARGGELMELAESLANESHQLMNAANQSSHMAWQALKFFRMGKYRRHAHESNELRNRAFRLLRQAGEVLQRAEKSLLSASVMLGEVGRNLDE